MRILKSRLLEREREQREAEMAKQRGEAQDISFGSQIRSYVLHPYTMVNDHRTNLKIGNAQGVLDGDLDELVHAELLRRAARVPALANMQNRPHLPFIDAHETQGPFGRCWDWAGSCLHPSGRTGTLNSRLSPAAAIRSRL